MKAEELSWRVDDKPGETFRVHRSIYTDPDLIDHRPNAALMKVNAVVGLLYGMLIQVMCSTFARSSVPPSGEASVHLLSIYGIERPAVVKGMNVDDQNRDYPPRKTARIQAIEYSPSYGQPIQFVTVTDGLDVEGWAGLGTVEQYNGYSGPGAIHHFRHIQITLGASSGFGTEMFNLQDVAHGKRL